MILCIDLAKTYSSIKLAGIYRWTRKMCLQPSNSLDGESLFEPKIFFGSGNFSNNHLFPKGGEQKGQSVGEEIPTCCPVSSSLKR